MSEQQSFIQRHTKAEVITGASVLAVGAALGATAYIRRRKHTHEQNTFTAESAELTERAKVFDYVSTEHFDLNLPSRLAVKLFHASTSGQNGGLTAGELLADYNRSELRKAKQQLKVLEAVGFVRPTDLYDGREGYEITPDLNQVFQEGLSEALQTGLYNK